MTFRRERLTVHTIAVGKSIASCNFYSPNQAVPPADRFQTAANAGALRRLSLSGTMAKEAVLPGSMEPRIDPTSRHEQTGA